jgi:glycerol uptake facilitator-like aquaporin
MIIKLLSELLGTLFLVMIVLGSGIMGENLAQGNVAIALLANSIATGAGLFVLIHCLGPISGAHLNPIVSLVEMLKGKISIKTFSFYTSTQFVGAFLGVILVHLMFNLELIQAPTHLRSGSHLFISEIIATFGLICAIHFSGKQTATTVALYITSAYWFTSSTSFANPAVTFARIFTNTFGGMEPSAYLPHMVAQVIGAVLAFLLIKHHKA